MAKATTQTAAKATPKPKLIWVFTLEAGVKNLFDVKDARPVGKADKHMVYLADPGHADIASDGSKPLFHSTSGVLEPLEVEAAIKAHAATKTPPPPPPTEKKRRRRKSEKAD
jgi:hypothetical protein